MDKAEVRAVIKYFCMYFCKKGMPQKKIHDDFIKILENGYPSYSTVKKWGAEFKRSREGMEDCEQFGRPKETTTDENVELVHTQSAFYVNLYRSVIGPSG